MLCRRYLRRQQPPTGGGQGEAFPPGERAEIARRLGVSEKTVGRVADLCWWLIGGQPLLDSRGNEAADWQRQAVVEGIAAAINSSNSADARRDQLVRVRRALESARAQPK